MKTFCPMGRQLARVVIERTDAKLAMVEARGWTVVGDTRDLELAPTDDLAALTDHAMQCKDGCPFVLARCFIDGLRLAVSKKS